MHLSTLFTPQKTFLFTFICILVLGGSCKKKSKEECSNCLPTPTNPYIPKGNKGNETVKDIYTENTVEQVTKEVTKSILAIASNTSSSICGANIDTLEHSSTNITLLVRFNPTHVCSEVGAKIKREGMIKISIQNDVDWAQKGSAISYEYQKFKIIPACDTCVSGTYSVEMNGMQRVTNLSGGREADLKVGDSLVTENFSRNLIYTYPDLSERIMNMRQIVVVTKTQTDLVTSITGSDTIKTGSFAGLTGVAIWGKIWNGKDFYVQYRTPKVYKTCNGNGKIVCANIYYHYKGAYTKTDIYGVNKTTGQPLNTCACSTEGFMESTVEKQDSIIKKIYKY